MTDRGQQGVERLRTHYGRSGGIGPLSSFLLSALVDCLARNAKNPLPIGKGFRLGWLGLADWFDDNRFTFVPVTATIGGWKDSHGYHRPNDLPA